MIPQEDAVPTTTVDTLLECKDAFQIHCIKNDLSMTVPHFASFVCVAMGIDRVRKNRISYESLLEVVRAMERPIITIDDSARTGLVGYAAGSVPDAL